MAHYRLTGRGMEHFTGTFGMVQFENGVSVGHVNKAEALRLGSLTRLEEVQDDGTSAQVSISNELVQGRNRGIEPRPPLERGKEPESYPEEITPAPQVVAVEDTRKPVDEDDEEFLEELEEALEVANNEALVEAQALFEANEAKLNPEPEVRRYTREELEEIADRDGIKGLREIGDKINVKGVAITTLITDILHRQDNPKVEN
jgi:hypothetical protein